MSAASTSGPGATAPGTTGRAAFVTSSVGLKVLVALSGLGMLGFLVGHMLGNLQAFEGPGKLNGYAELLRIEPLLLWTLRLGLLALLVMHVIATVRLTARNRAARGVGYRKHRYQEAKRTSRTMIFGGIAILLYVVYHLLHLTFHAVHASHTYVKDGHAHADVYRNVVEGFQNPVVSAIYVVAQVFLFLHLSHGVQSALRTLGVSHPRYVAWATHGGRAVALVIVLGFVSVPLAVLAGVIE